MYRLLIVDDEPQILEGIKCTLDWPRYHFSVIETATNAEEAVEKAIKLEPDIAIFDVCIGEVRGYDIISKLNELHLKTKYIMISGYDQFEYAQKAIRCGVKDYLLKPVSREDLRTSVEKILQEDFRGALSDTAQGDNETDPVLNVRYDTLSNLTNKILLMVKAESNKNLSLKSIADKFKMNSTYLGQTFLKETHLKFSEYLMVYRLLCAREKILSTTEKISYIAYSAGYTNLNYFYAQFKEYFNISPTDLREKQLSGTESQGKEGTL